MDKYTYGVSDNLKMEPQTKSLTQVQEQVELQSKLISELANEIDMLSNSLISVSRNLDSVPTSQEEKEMQVVPLAKILRDNNNYLIRNINRLQTIRNLLEL